MIQSSSSPVVRACAGGRLSTGIIRTQRSFEQRAFSVSRAVDRQKLVILGSGWGGYSLLRKVDTKRYDVTLISPKTYFTFTPLLASTAVGTLEFRCAIEPVRKFTPSVVTYQAWCDSINFTDKSLTCIPATPDVPIDILTAAQKPAASIAEPSGRFPHQGMPFKVRYDKLVISVGAYSQTFGIDGVKENAFFLKDVVDARAIRTGILDCFEQASQPTLNDVERRRLLHFCIVGGGPTGVEFGAELHDLIATDIRRHYPDLAKMARITLYDVAPKILQGFDAGLADYAEKKFAREGLVIKGNSHVTKVGQGYIDVKVEGRVHCGLLVWSTGLAPNPLVAGMAEVKKDDKTHGILTDDHLNVIMSETGKPNPNVWAIGDAATIEGQRMPATAQVASQEAKYLTKSLARLAKNKEVTAPFEWHNQGSLAYISGWEALYDRTQASDGPKTAAGGRMAWLLWRSAYISMTLSVRNKLVVPFYWFINWCFGRDISRF